MISLFKHYQPAQQGRLQELFDSPAWREALGGDPLTEAKLPPAIPAQMSAAARFLKEWNGARVQALIGEGEHDEEALLRALADWPAALAGGDDFPILFLGLALTLDCSFSPRCIYCNQQHLPATVTLEEWKALLAEVALPTPPYLYLTGGEPLLLGEALWGDDGIIAEAVRLGCAVNINTNAALITPRVAVQLVKIGTAKLHISLDCADLREQDALFGAPGRAEAVWQGIHNVQIARALLGAVHPQIHINCVLNKRNLFQFPALLRALLETRQMRSTEEGKLTDDPVFRDFPFHLIPIGGADNTPLRPSAEEWKRFYTETWEEAEEVWRTYLAQIGVPEDDRKALSAHLPYANPWLRVDHRISLDEYCAKAAEGVYWQDALSDRCYLAPSQGYVLPDGSQHWCGAHAIRRPEPLGNIREASFRVNIRRSLDKLDTLPGSACANCAGATCVINRTVEGELRKQVDEWVQVKGSVES